MAGKAPQYKRSWKNLLLNKRYQLRFTLFMVGVSAVLMTGLGLWVMKEANEATKVSMMSVRGNACPKIPEVTESAPPAAAPADDPAMPPLDVPPVPPADTVKELWCADAECTPAKAAPLTVKVEGCTDYVKAKLDSSECVDALKKAEIPVVKCDGGESFKVADAKPAPRRAAVVMEESSMTMTATLPPDFADQIVTHHICEMRQHGSLALLERGRMRILYVLIATGLMLMFGLAIYGIKMTHKVAGPLFKVQLYLAKMRDGRYDKVWNLRKGDQLMDFYEHFKHAHAGVVAMQKDDIERIKAVVEAAEAQGLGDHETVKKLKSLLKKKENAIE